jgi:hypothetical protein
MHPSLYLNPVGFVDFDPAGPTTVASGKVASVTVNGAGDYTVNLSATNALDPTASFLSPSIKGGALDGSVEADHTTDIAIAVLTATAGVAADRRFQLVIYDRGPQ